jgi:hypothetical protein
MARSNPNFKVIENEKPIDYTAELERLFSDAEDEADFAIIVAKRFSKLTFAQSSTLRTLAVAFYRNGRGAAPKSPKPVKDNSPITEQERAAKAMERAAERLRRSQEVVSLIEKRAMVKIAAEFTFHQLWKLGNDLGRKGDHRPVSEHTTKAQLTKAGVEIIDA